jgi:hypothetical protein
MPYPDSEYPSILRGRDKRDSQRLLAAAPEMLRVLREVRLVLEEMDDDLIGWRHLDATYRDELVSGTFHSVGDTIAKAEGRE